MLASASRRLFSSQLITGIHSTRCVISAIAGSSTTSTALSNCRYSSSSSSSNSRNGGIASRAPRLKAFKGKIRQMDNTTSPTVNAAPAVPVGPEVEVPQLQPPHPLENTSLPFVPTTGHLHRADVAVSTFFALHRPVSILFPVPGEYTPTIFSTIFDESTPMSTIEKHQRQYQVQSKAAGTATEPIDGEEALSYSASATAKASPSVMKAITHSPIQLPSHVLQSRFQHFTPPPPPEPIPNWSKNFSFNELNNAAGTRGVQSFYSDLIGRSRTRRNLTSRRKHVLTITHSKSETGGADMVSAHIGPEVGIQPFLQRMNERRKVYYEKMAPQLIQALSVKRQRRLKMKKHKYKKLMKKTRNARRRLEKQ